MEIISNILSSLTPEALFNLGGLASTLAVVILALVLMAKSEQIQQLKNSLFKLQRSFDELDEQAKLIVKTDLALNKTQEELDKKAASLYALHRVSRLISTTLDEKEIFKRINENAISELGFEKALIFIKEPHSGLLPKVVIGFPKERIENFINAIKQEEAFANCLEEGRMLFSLNLSPEDKEKISQVFSVIHFIIAPIMTQDGVIGLIFLGISSGATALSEGDDELISILASQIGQSLENARLFEEAYHAKQDLENKINERTKELGAALAEVKAISKMKSDFISAVSHELRTPLTSIKGYASILMAGKLGTLPEAVKERLEKINKHSDSLVKLINDLLDISRIEAGKVEMKFEAIPLNEIIASVIDLLQPQIKEKEIELKIDFAQKLPQVLVDRNQIERVFINLVGNAIKFTPSGGWIKISAQENPDFLEIILSDSGIGIAEADLTKIFEEFYRADNLLNQTLKGSGLGLSLAKYIVEAHKGRIWVKSQLNKGSEFHFTLPKVK